ncbi:hypothetical protein ACFQLX_02225 [Streptomyces polyrhachis]|uniref:Uncharacterized protein n=1 Tax=Streptomyces polyrhachis TaxID=1282885 RepID=A0ABW2GB48_9ACTN
MIDILIPAPYQVDEHGLRRVAVDELLSCVLDAESPWWRRDPCAVALIGRVPKERVPALMERVRDADCERGIRAALLEVLSDRVELLPCLASGTQQDVRHEREATILKMRALLGDRSALPALAGTVGSSEVRAARLCGAGLDALVARYGLDALLTDFDDRLPQDRIRALRVRHRAGEDVTDALADPDREVAQEAARTCRLDVDRLRAYLDHAPTPEAKLWATYALACTARGEAYADEVYGALGPVEVAGLDDEICRAIVHTYEVWSGSRTGPRWRLEALYSEPPAPVDEEGQLLRVAAALAAAGLSPQPPSSGAHDHGGGGRATYHAIGFADGRSRLLVSTLGRFVTGEDPGRTDSAVRRALESEGFRWIDDATGAVAVPDLAVGVLDHHPDLSVRDVLFFWTGCEPSCW